jgi:signal transduction histidine kinase
MKIKVYLILFCVVSVHLLPFSLSAQQNREVDDLLREAKKKEENKEYWDALQLYRNAISILESNGKKTELNGVYKKLGLVNYRLKQFEKAKDHFFTCIQNDSTDQIAADAFFNLSLIFRKQKNRDSLLWSLKRSLNIYDKLKDSEEKLKTHHKGSIIYKQLGLYQEAIKYSLKAYDGYNEYGNLPKKATVSETIGKIQRLMGNYNVAKKYLYESLKLRKQLVDSPKISHALNNLANLYKDIGEYDSAIINYDKAIQIQKKLKQNKELGKMMNNLASAHYLNNDIDKALNTYSEALTLKKKVNDSLSMMLTYNELASLLMLKNKISDSRKYLDSVKLLLKETAAPESLLRYYEIESDYYKRTKNHSKAIVFKQKEYDLYRQIFKKEQAANIQKLQEQFESRLKDVEITQLNSDNTIKQSIIDLQKTRIQNRNLLLILSSFIISLLVGVYFFLKQRQKIKIKNIENDKLKAVLEGQEKIKNHISKDLHDMIPTSYDAIRLKILALTKTKKTQEVGDSIIEDIRKVNEEVRMISHRLSPLGNRLKDNKLTELIEDHFTEFQHYRNIFIHVDLPLPEVLNQINIESQTNFYGIVLEVLNNIEKHSKANSIKVTHGVCNEKNMSFKICDNGIGLVQKEGSGIGLGNIENRTLLLEGKFHLDSTEKGTCAELIFPLTPHLK